MSTDDRQMDAIADEVRAGIRNGPLRFSPSTPLLSRMRDTYSLEGIHAVLWDQFGGKGLHTGCFLGGVDDHHDKHVSGFTIVDRIAWAERRIQDLERARDNMVAMLEGRDPRTEEEAW